MSDEVKTIRPQKGPQMQFLSSKADIVLYGGAAGGGKSFALLLEPLRHAHNPEFGGVIFRRTIKQVKNEGGLFDESSKIYPLLGASPNMSDMYWKFPSGCTVSFSHLEHEKNIFDYQGAQICFMGFDELTHFSKKMFFYMLSRNRSTCGVRPYIRATTNPDKKSWVRHFIDWWIYPKGHPQAGFPIPERAGVVRWFIVQDDKVIWKDNKEDFGPGEDPKSFTFIPAKITDNQILMQRDPSYIANLKALSRVERAKLLDGNWDAEEGPGELFQRQWFPIMKEAPKNLKKTVRYWDRAASESETADWTVGLKLGQLENDQIIVLDMVRFRGTPKKVEDAVKNVAAQDGKTTQVGLEQDPGQAGKMEAEYLAGKLAGYTVTINKATEDKVTRAKPVSSQAEIGNILVLERSWNEDFFVELEAFPDGSHDDIVDALSGGFDLIHNSKVGTFTDLMADFGGKQNLGNW